MSNKSPMQAKQNENRVFPKYNPVLAATNNSTINLK